MSDAVAESSMLALERHGAIAVVRYATPPRNFLTLRVARGERCSSSSRSWRRWARGADVRAGLAGYGAELARQLDRPEAEQPSMRELVELLERGATR